MSLLSAPQQERLIDGLAGPGWAVVTDVGTPALRAALRNEASGLARAGALRPAGIGQGAGTQRHETVRKDRIAWLAADASPAQGEYLAGIAALQAALNRSLYLGLVDVEAHYAQYLPGDYYRKHRDRFERDDARTVSTVYYLNPGWRAEEGGALQIFAPDEPARCELEVAPEDGVLVCFLSERIWHAVADTARERLSIAGWLRRPRLL